jgi:predicted CoA-binding protein
MSILSAFSHPRAVVVVGASANPQKLGHVIIKNLVQVKMCFFKALKILSRISVSGIDLFGVCSL